MPNWKTNKSSSEKRETQTAQLFTQNLLIATYGRALLANNSTKQKKNICESHGEQKCFWWAKPPDICFVLNYRRGRKHKFNGNWLTSFYFSERFSFPLRAIGSVNESKFWVFQVDLFL